MDLKKIFFSRKKMIFRIIAIVLVIIASVCFIDHKKYISSEVSASIISGIFTIITFLGTVVAICITWKTNKEKSLLEVVTKNRAEWVKELKKLFSEYFTKYDELKDTKNSIISNTNSDQSTIAKECTLTQIKTEISLRLNPIGKIDNEILNDLSRLTNEFGKYRKSDLRDKTETKIKLYLKCEWERIKFEAKEGLKKYDFEYEFEKVQLINYILDENVDREFIKVLLNSGKIPYEFIRGCDVLNEKKNNNFKEKIIARIKDNNFKREEVIEFRNNIERELSLIP
ncbi:hypothetical protein [Clostridium perfringens]|uniref:hypothetical protein n=1 Tax=Clostridium perfringens TaxID=1502 RepID=UPI0024BC2F0D|nr:hypothetical protein [Clostridium perfringens]MDM0625040.1 hypothetical protein [Clostridium perfringens]